MSAPRKAVPRTPPPPEAPPVRKYRVLSRRCVWGKKGEVIDKAFPPSIELCLLQSGTLERVPEEPEKTARPLKSAEKEG